MPLRPPAPGTGACTQSALNKRARPRSGEVPFSPTMHQGRCLRHQESLAASEHPDLGERKPSQGVWWLRTCRRSRRAEPGKRWREAARHRLGCLYGECKR